MDGIVQEQERLMIEEYVRNLANIFNEKIPGLFPEDRINQDIVFYQELCKTIPGGIEQVKKIINDKYSEEFNNYLKSINGFLKQEGFEKANQGLQQMNSNVRKKILTMPTNNGFIDTLFLSLMVGFSCGVVSVITYLLISR